MLTDLLIVIPPFVFGLAFIIPMAAMLGGAVSLTPGGGVEELRAYERGVGKAILAGAACFVLSGVLTVACWGFGLTAPSNRDGPYFEKKNYVMEWWHGR